MKRKKWIAILTVVLVLGGAALVAAKSKDKSDPKAQSSPFRLGKVQAEDLQVSVREVGVVDPVTKVDVKSAVSGRVLSLEVRALEYLWKREEELARIIDEELTPRRLLEEHLRRLPVRLGPRRSRLRDALPQLDRARGRAAHARRPLRPALAPGLRLVVASLGLPSRARRAGPVRRG